MAVLAPVTEQRIRRQKRILAILLIVAVLGSVRILFDSMAVKQKFTKRQFSKIKTTSESSVNRRRIDVAMVFDGNRLNFSKSVVRSLMYYSRDPVVLHLVTPQSLHYSLHEWPSKMPGNLKIRTYDYSRCEAFTRTVSFIARHIHMSAMCKVFLSEIIPAEHILYIDSDVTVVSNIAYCWLRRGNVGTSLGSSALMAMGVDMGEICQSSPDLCYPIGMRFRIPPGLVCGTTPKRAKRVVEEGRKCQAAGEFEPFQFNGGVALMNLKRMRKVKFSAKFIRASIYTWRELSYKQAKWGEQDLLNNYFRLYPESVVSLPCGCNFQYSAVRRESKCGNQTVVVAHGWTRQMMDVKSQDGYNKHFNYFRNSDIGFRNKGAISPPRLPTRSRTAPDWLPPSLPETNGKPVDVAYRELDSDCSLQSHHCARDGAEQAAKVDISILNDTVNVLSRTSRRPLFFKEMSATVREQTHAYIHHVVGTDDVHSRLTFLRHINGVVAFKQPTRPFDPLKVCRKCKSPSGDCGRAPPLKHAKLRQHYLDCYCSTEYPMNSYMNELQARAKRGWVLYLDDDNMFEHSHAVAELLASIESRNSVIAFRAHLGRLTPSNFNFARRKVVMGDFDSSNFAFHTDFLRYAKWGDRRCGDFRVAHNLANKLPIQWIDHSFIQANPLRAGLGGLGMQNDMESDKITVVVTSYLGNGWRPTWVRRIVETYTSKDIAHIVSKVILVWNNATEDVPKMMAQLENEKFVILRQGRNSLNNRWIQVLPFVKTEVVLNLDDDVYVNKEGLICLLGWWRKDKRRLVGPFVRRIEGDKYIIDELIDSTDYSVVLPRVLLVPTNLLRIYAAKQYEWFHRYVDRQEAHCDDILLNILAHKRTTPLRVLLPSGSVVDFYDKCFKVDSLQTGGLALQKDRARKRSICVRDLKAKFGVKAFKLSNNVATCLHRGNPLEIVDRVEKEKYLSMKDLDFGDCAQKPHSGV